MNEWIYESTEPQTCPSSRGRRLWLWSVLGIAALIFVFFAVHRCEFRYQGKTFAEWYSGLTNTLIGYQVPGLVANPNQPLVETLHIYGTNAIPFLRQELRPDWPIKLKVIQFLEGNPWIPRMFIPRQHDPRRAWHLIPALGPVAKDLLPEITQQFTNSTTPAIQAFALAAIGPDGFPPLCQALESPDIRKQEAAADVLGRVAYDISPAIPSLLRCLDSSNVRVGGAAAYALRNNFPQKPELLSNSLPHLINTVENGGITNKLLAISILRFFGTSAIPVLQKTLTNSPNERIRKDTADALRRIMPHVSN